MTGVAMMFPAARALPAEEGKAPQGAEKLKVLVLVGGHGYEQAGFAKLWAGYEDMAVEVWKGSPYTAFDDIANFPYEVIVMYNMSSGMTDTQKQNFLKLLERGVGLVVWHHALANCQDWPEFEKIAGAKFWLKPDQRNGAELPRSGTGSGLLNIHVADPNHPITKGLADFQIQDETYNRQTFKEGIHVLLTTDHPRSDKNIAWVHQYGKARVFGYQSGHDAKAWTNEGFRHVFGQGIRWAARRLP
jgi:type 1 glutamine amidotransferase